MYAIRSYYGMRTSELQQEIAEHQSTERALRESEERFRLIFDTTGAGMNTFNVHGRFIQVNPRLCSMLGYSEQELLQKTVEEITAPEDLELTRSRITSYNVCYTKLLRFTAVAPAFGGSAATP